MALLSAFAFLMACASFAGFVCAIYWLVFGTPHSGDVPGLVFILLLAPPLAAGGFYHTYKAVFVRIAFNSVGLQHRQGRQNRFWRWQDIEEIDCNRLTSPRIWMKDGTGVRISATLRGFPALLAEARRRSVRVIQDA